MTPNNFFREDTVEREKEVDQFKALVHQNLRERPRTMRLRLAVDRHAQRR